MRVIVLSNIRFPEPHVETMLASIIKREEPDTIIFNGDVTQCYWDYECPRVIDALYVIRSIAPWAQIIYILGDMDSHAGKCITSEPRYRDEIVIANFYVIETSSNRYFITHGHQGDIDMLRKQLDIGPWDWIVISQWRKLLIDRMARIIYTGGLSKEYPPESRGYLIITDSSHILKKLL